MHAFLVVQIMLYTEENLKINKTNSVIESNSLKTKNKKTALKYIHRHTIWL